MDKQYPTFVKNFDLIIKNFKHHKRYLADKRLTQTEKKVLQAHCYIRDNKNRAALELLEQISETNEYLKAHINLLSGLAYNNISFFQRSKKRLEKAKITFQVYESKYLFLTLVNLYTCELNLLQNKEMNKIFQELSDLEFQNIHQDLVFKRIKFNFHIHTDEFEKAYEMLDDLYENFENFKVSVKPAFLIDVFNLAIKTDNFQLAYKSLDKLKTIKKYHLTENYKFMKALLDFIDSNQAIYITEGQLQKVPMLQHQLMCIKYLAMGDRESARKHWGELRETKPHVYLDNFETNMPKCLFSIALNKANSNRSKWTFEIHDRMSKTQKLQEIFSHLEDPIKKVDLYRLIYEQEAHDKNDLLKLSKLISKFRKKSTFKIQTQFDSYSVEVDKSQKKAG